MRPRIVDNPLGTVLDQEFQELECLVYLSPFFGRLLCESLIDHGHDLVEQLAGSVSWDLYWEIRDTH
jgi:hypothetical protein